MKPANALHLPVSQLAIEIKDYLKLTSKTYNIQPYKITKQGPQYYALDNNKSFIAWNEDKEYNTIWLNIREDGNTRTVYNGRITDTHDFITIYRLTLPEAYKNQ